MMMIAFITIKSSLVPLIESLCAQIYFKFEISVVCSHHLLFFFVKEKTCEKKTKRQLVQTSTCSPAYIYKCVLHTPHGIYVHYHYSTSGFLPGSPGVSSRHPGSHPSTLHAVCVCVRTHTHNTYTSTPFKKWGDTSIAQQILNPKRPHLESSKQNYYIISLRAIIKAIFTSPHTGNKRHS